MTLGETSAINLNNEGEGIAKLRENASELHRNKEKTREKQKNH